MLSPAPEVTPTKAECLDAFADSFLRAVIRIEQDRLDRQLAAERTGSEVGGAA